ncbi:NAD(P)-dependent oxidoreductase [Rossellomorea marisflavi]|uniref:NAD(P)-dependent oxidoreductase n=1 Tax=Rossellomorea marisflavi TaxID=189381 RepID=UPI003FA0D2C7
MKIIVFGATGATGAEVLKQAKERGLDVTAFVRDPAKLPDHSTFIQGDATDRQAVHEALQGQDAVISCLGASGLGKTTQLSTMTGHILSGMQLQGARSIHYVASAGIDHEITGFQGKLAQFILRNVLKDHREAVSLIKDSGFRYTIARPMQLINGPFTGEYRTHPASIPEGGKKISRADVAHFLLESLDHDAYANASIGLSY